MFYLTCNRIGYKLLDPHIWEVFGGKYNTESLGFTKHFSGTGTFEKCDPPRYIQIDDSHGFTVILPPGSSVVEEEWDPFPPHLQGPEVNEIRNTTEQRIWDIEQEVNEYREERGALEVEVEQLKIKLKNQKPSGSIRWKLTYTWCYGTEVYWDFKTKKQAVAFMEEEIAGFFGNKLVESIRDIKYDKYIYGTRNIQKE
tara:strand:+ start:895 stop:1488 length:594 start_codon:yes stop_codon:yes gene_type:complete